MKLDLPYTNRFVYNEKDTKSRHWSYDRENRVFNLVNGRREAGYVIASPQSKAFDDTGENCDRRWAMSEVGSEEKGRYKETGDGRRAMTNWEVKKIQQEKVLTSLFAHRSS